MRTRTKKILLVILIFAVLGLLSCGLFFLLKALNITNIKTLREFISGFGAWSWVVFILTQVIISTPIFVVPLEDELWVTLSILLFGAKVGCIISIVSMLLITANLYLLGNKLGNKLATKIIGEEALEIVQNKLEVKGKVSLPLMYFIPFFPHDVLCVVAGLTKMNFWYFFVVSAIIRPIEIVTICFLGGNLINWASLSAFDWIIFVNLALIDIFLLKKLSCYMEEKLEKKRQKQQLDDKKSE